MFVKPKETGYKSKGPREARERGTDTTQETRRCRIAVRTPCCVLCAVRSHL
jgi:hypothetical protein